MDVEIIHGINGFITGAFFEVTWALVFAIIISVVFWFVPRY